jgi:P4 family phage/plasmid primase-like protien
MAPSAKPPGPKSGGFSLTSLLSVRINQVALLHETLKVLRHFDARHPPGGLALITGLTGPSQMTKSTFTVERMTLELDLCNTAAQAAELRSRVETLNDPTLTAFHAERVATLTRAADRAVAAAEAGTISVLAAPAATERFADFKVAARTALLARIAGAKDVDELTGAVAKAAETDTRAGELFVVRSEVKEAIKAKAKTFGVKLTAPMLNLMFPASKKATARRGGPEFTETGITDRMHLRHGHELMYTADTKSWYRFDANVWQKESSDVRIVELARLIVADLPAEAASLVDPERHDEALKEIKQLQRVNVARCAVAGLAGEHGIVSESEELDTHPELLCVANGMVDLRTGALLPADPHAKLTMATRCDYKPEAKAPVFVETVRDALRGNQEHVDFLQRLLGYALMADPKERVLVVPLGGGKNAKSTIFNAIQKVMADHVATMGSETIAAVHNSFSADSAAPREDLLRLRGTRMIFASEIRRGTVFVDNTVKTLAGGGDIITARGLREKFIEFKPTCVVIAPTNVLPIVREDDPAVWDRLVLVPFLARFELKDGGIAPDVDRPAKLQAEQEGILAWLVQGALAYQAQGLAIPASIEALKTHSRNGVSPISMFLEDYCVIEPDALESTDALFAAWRLSAMEQGEKFTAGTKIGFGRTMASHGFVGGLRIKGEDGSRIRGFKGLRLKTGVRYCPEQLVIDEA